MMPANSSISETTKRTRRPRPKSATAPKAVFQVILAAQVVILVSMWNQIPQISPSPHLKSMNDSAASNIGSSKIWHPSSKESHSTSRNEQRNGIPSNVRHKYPFQHKHGSNRILNEAAASSHSQQLNSNTQNLPILVIGGSDGSGTRSFADAVRRLGVPMKMDLKTNLDVQSGEIFEGQGFPPLVNLILKDTKSINYEVHDLTNTTRRVALRETRKFQQGVLHWKMGVERSRIQSSRATSVSIGFKAPATVLLLPLLKQVFGPMRYIHVVRDGRDVSLSTNQSPVKKFYNSTYIDALERRNKYSNGFESVLAMHLWNDWNTQALEWEQTHAKEDDFDFLVVRSEDLVDPEKKFETLSKIANFVGSPMTMKDVCCLSRQDAVDLGQSVNWTGKKDPKRIRAERRMKDNSRPFKYGALQQRKSLGHGDAPKLRLGRLWDSFRSHPDDLREVATPHSQVRKGANKKDQEDNTAPTESPPKVNQRYGKWKSILKDKPEVSAKLHEEGAKGLATFGYEPFQARFGDGRPLANDFTCDDRVACE